MAKKKTSVPDHGEADLSLDAWRRALGADTLPKINQNAKTIPELSRELEIPERTVRQWVMNALRDGKATQFRKIIVDRSGRNQYHIAYQLTVK